MDSDQTMSGSKIKKSSRYDKNKKQDYPSKFGKNAPQQQGKNAVFEFSEFRKISLKIKKNKEYYAKDQQNYYEVNYFEIN